ncbi:hypothetical protein DCAR_0625023 [Daucus carota subsp. sativus]|uniref:Uncharacterized protein n=1 Tax=Daucus carota subsp. sativus TaxID=79200 RepID=A0AAF0XF15_DAUCS|nr:hypothetical protein DCAR_0625023 [Daucus carota subsp. sativus]
MASQDQARRKKKSEVGEKQSVSKQFESLTESPERAQNVGKFEMQGEEGEGDIGKYRQAAQQNSIDAIRAAQERYEKAKETATTVKDKAVVSGWGAGEYTAEKVAEATKAAANVTAGAAGYVGEKAVAAKDKVGSVGVSAKDYAAQKLAAATDAVVAAQESAKEYAARKRAEAEREMLAKQSAEAEERHDDIAGAVGEFSQAEPEYGHEGQQGGFGGVLQAIGETVIEIGQTAKDFLVGKG